MQGRTLQEKYSGNITGYFVIGRWDAPSKHSHADALSSSREKHEWSTAETIDERNGNECGKPVFKFIESRD